MAAAGRPSLRFRIALLTVAVAVGAIAAIALSRTIVGGGGDDEVVRLDRSGEWIDPANSNPLHAGSLLPDVTLTDAVGEAVALEPDGRPMVVNLWYSTCPPCIRELTYFAAVHAELGDAVRFVGVNSFDDVDTMLSFAGERGVEYELLLDPADRLGNALRVVQMPVTLFVDPDGEVVSQTGALSESELRQHVNGLL